METSGCRSKKGFLALSLRLANYKATQGLALKENCPDVVLFSACSYWYLSSNVYWRACYNLQLIVSSAWLSLHLACDEQVLWRQNWDISNYKTCGTLLVVFLDLSRLVLCFLGSAWVRETISGTSEKNNGLDSHLTICIYSTNFLFSPLLLCVRKGWFIPLLLS